MPRFLVTVPAVLAMVACGASDVHDVTVVGTDYAFEVPSTMPAGPTAFAFENRGKVDHEVIFALLREGHDVEEVLKAIEEGLDPGEMVEGGASILIAGPAETSVGKVLLDLQPGRTYALICTFRDGEGAPPHTALGMFGSFEVE